MIRPLLLQAAVLALLTVMACSNVPPAQNTATTNETSGATRVNKVAQKQQPVPSKNSTLADSIFAGGTMIATSRAAIITRLGRPDSVTSVSARNRYTPEIPDSVVTLFYPTLAIAFYKVGASNKDMLAWIGVADTRWLRVQAVAVGASESELLRVLGEPDRRNGNRLVYICTSCEAGGEESITFVMAGNAVKSVEFSYWID